MLADPTQGEPRFVCRVPATSANLGPGFDTLGLAFALHNEFAFSVRQGAAAADGHVVDVQGFGSGVLEAPADNLALVAYETTCRARGFDIRPLRLSAVNRVPTQAGLGSSATAIIAGVAAAHGLHGGSMGGPRPADGCEAARPELDREQILVDALRLEPHPDNLAPCLWGGFTAGVVSEGGPLVSRTQIDLPLKGWVILPEGAVNTRESRRQLPAHYSRQDVIFSLSRAAVLTAALIKGELDPLFECMRDRIHEPTRMDPRLDLPGLKDRLEGDGVYGLAVSGSGPAILILCRERTERMKAVAAAHLTGRVAYTEYLLGVDNVGLHVGADNKPSATDESGADAATPPPGR